MNAYRTHAVVQNDGRVVLDRVPMKAGQEVEVLLLAPSIGELPAGKGRGLQAALLNSPTLSDEEVRRIEEAQQWLAKWQIES